jgi:uncharacterized protein
MRTIEVPEAFVDTSGWGAFFVRTEAFHTAAVEHVRRWRSDGTRLITTNYVLTELVALLTRPLGLPRQGIVTAVETLRSESRIEIVHVDPILDAEAWTLLKQRQDKN